MVVLIVCNFEMYVVDMLLFKELIKKLLSFYVIYIIYLYIFKIYGLLVLINLK